MPDGSRPDEIKPEVELTADEKKAMFDFRPAEHRDEILPGKSERKEIKQIRPMERPFNF